MKLKIKKELKIKSVDELRAQLIDARKHLTTIRIDHARNKVKDTSSLVAKRTEIAWILTFLKEKEAKNG